MVNHSMKWIKKTIRKNGYVLVRDNGILNCPFAWSDGRIYEHVLVIWLNNVPYDPSSQDIHHKDDNKQNNHLENLEVLPKTMHPYYTRYNFNR